MPITIANVSFYKSAHTVSGQSSLGGAIAAGVSSQAAAQPVVITGVTITQVFGVAPGSGTLSYNPATQMLGWKSAGSSTTDFSVPIAANGSYVVGSAVQGFVAVNVTYAALPSTYKIESIVVSSPIGTVFGQVTAAAALIGDTQYKCLYFKNNHPSLTANDVRLYIHSPVSPPQTFDIGLAPEGVGNGTTTGVAEALASASTPPFGVTFSAPTQATSGIPIGTLLPGQCVGIWQRRTVPPMSYGNLRIAEVTLGAVLVG